MASNDQTPNPLQAPNEIVIPVRLDLEAAEQQLTDFCTRVQTKLSSAVATGLGVHSLTVAMVGPTEQDL